MKATTLGSLALSLATLAVIATSSSAYAAQAVKKIAPSAANKATLVQRTLPCDLSISYVQYFNCPCNINLDAYYVDQYMSVKVFNQTDRSATATLKVKYFDILQNRLVTITRNVTFSGRGSQNVAIHHNRPMLIKRSHGVHAEVALTSSNLQDPDLSNNQMTQYTCGPVVE